MKKKAIIIFTRYPEIGKTKTRLIPAIGAEKSANLQRLMTETTLSSIELLTNIIDIEVNIYFQGGNKELMQQWLGDKYNFYPQIEGDLGEKMYRAFKDNFEKKNEQVIIIGVDCLELNVDILREAFLALNNHDLVIGKALDGGYYLLGLNSLEKSLFDNIKWGTNQVFSQTMSIVQTLNYSTYQLPILRDIDRAGDLYFVSFEY
ncbi:TIGR04282 family arsenosugar biosynthesis glycosyltransferase [Geminocystis herdmanii]|uniref:TIGR04282 family arsenosugar biosynthesis glycosyltransferase n=1 Tax=Geminocystis herdmanii TaxID=669359 RepID=UPI000346809E|nr:TIGR04282 family arsenosugar biosynthesis glycosyltransferase [Geminocystis herdmanii]